MKLTYDSHFRSKREDGRLTSSLAAHMEMLRHYRPLLAYPENTAKETFPKWQSDVRKKITELLAMPEKTEQPAPVMLSRTEREGYAVEKWELYPDEYTAVPFLILIPDGADADHPVPGVLCLPGSCFSKEFLAGEPLLESPACRFEKYPERNRMALTIVRNGMAAFVFDHPEIAECGLDIADETDWGYYVRTQLCFGLIQSGMTYAGLSVFQKLCCLDFMKTLPYIDREKLAVCAHSLGTVPALCLGLLRDEIKAVVFNDFVCDPRIRYAATTEEDSRSMNQNDGNWHEIPGLWKWFGYQDLLAALAPKYLALNEGGADEFVNTVRAAYACMEADDRLSVSYYPKYADPETRIHPGSFPRFGLGPDEYFEYSYVNAPDHSFRAEPSVRLLKRCFNLES